MMVDSSSNNDCGSEKWRRNGNRPAVVSGPHLVGWPLGAGPRAGGAGAGHEARQTGDPRACVVHARQDAKPVARTYTLQGGLALLCARER